VPLSKSSANNTLSQGLSCIQEEAESEEEDMQEDLATPSFEFRFECAKLLIELDETTESAVHVSSPLL